MTNKDTTKGFRNMDKCLDNKDKVYETKEIRSCKL